MGYDAVPLTNLIEKFSSLPGIGSRTAQRLAFYILTLSEQEISSFSNAILDAHRQIKHCNICQNLTDQSVCGICSCRTRDHSTICVVEDAKDVLAFERTKEYDGLYHVLHGLISPMDGIGPAELSIKPLLKRLAGNQVKEVILCTNPTVEGEATAMYLSKLMKPLGMIVSRLAFGLPVGGNLEYADEVTLFKALENRNLL